MVRVTIALDDNLTIGGNFLNSETLVKTLSAVAICHYFGDQVCNNPYRATPLLVFKLTKYYLDTLRDDALMKGQYSEALQRRHMY